MILNIFERVLINTPWRARVQRGREAAEVLARLPFLEDSDCIELGCGSGIGSLLIKHYTGCRTLTSFDIDPIMIGKARHVLDNPPKWALEVSTNGIGFKQGDACSIPMADNSVDAAFHFFLLDHIQHWPAVIAEVHRVLKPGGIYSFEDALLPDSVLALNNLFGHVPINSDELTSSLVTSGFHIDRMHIGKYGFKRCYVLARKKRASQSVELHGHRTRA